MAHVEGRSESQLCPPPGPVTWRRWLGHALPLRWRRSQCRLYSAAASVITVSFWTTGLLIAMKFPRVSCTCGCLPVVCAYVSVCLCVCLCMCVIVHVCLPVCARMSVCTCLPACTCQCACMSVCTYQHACEHVSVCTCVCMCAHITFIKS